jgi:hypothetical protein
MTPGRIATGTPLARFLNTIPARKTVMTHVEFVMIQPLVALIFGILILIGLTGLFPHLFTATT